MLIQTEKPPLTLEEAVDQIANGMVEGRRRQKMDFGAKKTHASLARRRLQQRFSN